MVNIDPSDRSNLCSIEELLSTTRNELELQRKRTCQLNQDVASLKKTICELEVPHFTTLKRCLFAKMLHLNIKWMERYVVFVFRTNLLRNVKSAIRTKRWPKSTHLKSKNYNKCLRIIGLKRIRHADAHQGTPRCEFHFRRLFWYVLKWQKYKVKFSKFSL